MNNNRGMALISAIVSIAILTVALTMATSAYLSSTKVSKHAINLSIASNFTEGVMEREKSRPFDAIRTTEITNNLPMLSHSKCKVSVTAPEDGLKEITAECSWVEGKAPYKVVFSTMVARGGVR